MRGWLAANLFLIGMSLAVAGVVFVGFKIVRTFHLEQINEQRVMVVIAVGSLVLVGWLGSVVLAQIQRRAR